MIWFVCSTASVCVIALTVALCVITARRRAHGQAAFGTMPVGTMVLAGVFLAVTAMIYPLYLEHGPVQGLLITLVNSLRIMGLEDDFTLVRQAVSSPEFPAAALGRIYSFYASALYLAYPIVTGVLVVTLFRSLREKVRYSFGHKAETVVFSELNEQAVTLAEDIRAGHPEARIVFTDVSQETRQNGGALTARAESINAICIEDDVASLGFRRGVKYTLLLLDMDEARNIRLLSLLTRRLIASVEARIRLDSLPRGSKERAAIARGLFNDGEGELRIIKRFASNVDIRVFSCSPEAELMTDSIMARYYERCPGADGLRVSCVNDVRIMAQDILEKRPLFIGEKAGEDGKKHISVLIVGCGGIGVEFFKTAVWCSRMKDRVVRFTLADKDASAVLKPRLEYECPELFEARNMAEYGEIRFIDADLETDGVGKIAAGCPDATYVIVACGDDSLNIRTATELRTLYQRIAPSRRIDAPVINVRVQDAYRAAMVRATSTPDEAGVSLALEPFGEMAAIYRESVMLDPASDGLCAKLHVRLMLGALAPEASPEQREKYRQDAAEQLRSLYRSEYNRSSTRSWLLHMKYRMKSFGVEMADWSAPLGENDMLRLMEAIKDEPVRTDCAARLEHERWNAFLRTRGYVTASAEQVRRYARLVARPEKSSHQNKAARQHPCITSWDGLDGVSALCVELGIKAEGFSFKKNDDIYDMLDFIAADMAKEAK